MSYLEVGRVFDLDIPFPEKIVALALAHHNNKGKCFPGLQRLAKTTGCCRVSVGRFLKKLEILGFVKIKRKRGRANHYDLALDRVKAINHVQPVTSSDLFPAGTSDCELLPPVNSSTPDQPLTVTLTSNRTSNSTGNGSKSQSKPPPTGSFKNWDEDKFMEECKAANAGNRYLSELEFSKFVRYYSEQDENSKMKVNLAKTWSTSGRMATWKGNMLQWHSGFGKKAVNYFEQPTARDIFAQ